MIAMIISVFCALLLWNLCGLAAQVSVLRLVSWGSNKLVAHKEAAAAKKAAKEAAKNSNNVQSAPAETEVKS